MGLQMLREWRCLQEAHEVCFNDITLGSAGETEETHENPQPSDQDSNRRQ
jgi:hypothetical protein